MTPTTICDRPQTMAILDASPLLLLLLVTATALSQGDDALQNCAAAGDEDCAERRVVAMVDALDNHTTIDVFPGTVTLVRVARENLTREEEEAATDLEDRVDRFLSTHSVHVRVGDVGVDLGLDALRSPREAASQGNTPSSSLSPSSYYHPLPLPLAQSTH